MINTLLGKVFGTKNEREVKRMLPRVEAISALEPEIKKLSDDQLRAKTDEFRARIQERLGRIADEADADPDRRAEIETERYKALQEVLNELLVEAFAVVREAGRRVLNMRHFDVQLIGGIVLHEGTIAEMKTGEGKTLVATLPVYLNALSGRGALVVTVNDCSFARYPELCTPEVRALTPVIRRSIRRGGSFSSVQRCRLRRISVSSMTRRIPP